MRPIIGCLQFVLDFISRADRIAINIQWQGYPPCH